MPDQRIGSAFQLGQPLSAKPIVPNRPVRFCAIGASAGGVTAVRFILSHLKGRLPFPIGVVQHMPASSRMDVSLIYGTSVASATPQVIFEVEDKMPIEQGCVYMAAPSYHLLVERDHTFALTQDEYENYSRPSIDVFFRSISRVYGASAVGILLTGANADGAAGLETIGSAGGFTIVQDPREAECDIMPKAALALRAPDRVLKLGAMVDYLNSLSTGEIPVGNPPTGSEGFAK